MRAEMSAQRNLRCFIIFIFISVLCVESHRMPSKEDTATTSVKAGSLQDIRGNGSTIATETIKKLENQSITEKEKKVNSDILTTTETEEITTDMSIAVTDVSDEYDTSTRDDSSFTSMTETSEFASTETNPSVTTKRKRVREKGPRNRSVTHMTDTTKTLDRSESRFESELNLFPFSRDNNTSNNKKRRTNRMRGRISLDVSNKTTTELSPGSSTTSMEKTTDTVPSMDYSDSTIYTIETSTLGSEETLAPKLVHPDTETNISNTKDTFSVNKTLPDKVNNTGGGENRSVSVLSAEIDFENSDYEITKSITFRNETRRTLKNVRKIATRTLNGKAENGTSSVSEMQEVTIIVLSSEKPTHRRKTTLLPKNTTAKSTTNATKLTTITVQDDITTPMSTMDENETSTIDDDGVVTTTSSVVTTAATVTKVQGITKGINLKQNSSSGLSPLQQTSPERLTLRERRHKYKFQRQGAASLITLKVQPIRLQNTTLSQKSEVEASTDPGNFSVTTEVTISETPKESSEPKVIRRRSADVPLKPPPKFSSISDPTRNHRFVAGSTKKNSQSYPRTLTPGYQNSRTKFRSKYHRHLAIKGQRNNESEHEIINKFRVQETKDSRKPSIRNSGSLDNETSAERVTTTYATTYSEPEQSTVNQKLKSQRSRKVPTTILRDISTESTEKSFVEEKVRVVESSNVEETGLSQKFSLPIKEYYGEISYYTNKNLMPTDFTNAVTVSVNQEFTSSSLSRKRGKTRATIEQHTTSATELPSESLNKMTSVSSQTSVEQLHSEFPGDIVTTLSPTSIDERYHRSHPRVIVTSHSSPTSAEQYNQPPRLVVASHDYLSPTSAQQYNEELPHVVVTSHSSPRSPDQYYRNPLLLVDKLRSSPTIVEESHSENPYVVTSRLTPAVKQLYSDPPRTLDSSHSSQIREHYYSTPSSDIVTNGHSDVLDMSHSSRSTENHRSTSPRVTVATYDYSSPTRLKQYYEEYVVTSNSSPRSLDKFNRSPSRIMNTLRSLPTIVEETHSEKPDVATPESLPAVQQLYSEPPRIFDMPQSSQTAEQYRNTPSRGMVTNGHTEVVDISHSSQHTEHHPSISPRATVATYDYSSPTRLRQYYEQYLVASNSSPRSVDQFYRRPSRIMNTLRSSPTVVEQSKSEKPDVFTPKSLPAVKQVYSEPPRIFDSSQSSQTTEQYRSTSSRGMVTNGHTDASDMSHSSQLEHQQSTPPLVMVATYDYLSPIRVQQYHEESPHDVVTSHSSPRSVDQFYRKPSRVMNALRPSPIVEQSYSDNPNAITSQSSPTGKQLNSEPTRMLDTSHSSQTTEHYRSSSLSADGYVNILDMSHSLQTMEAYKSTPSHEIVTDGQTNILDMSHSSQNTEHYRSTPSRGMVTNMMMTTFHPRAKTTTKNKMDNRSNSFMDAVTRRANSIFAAVQQAVAVVLEVPKQLWLLPARLGLYPETKTSTSRMTTQSTW